VLLPDDTVFPNNVVGWVASAMETIDADVKVFKRALRNSDPQQSIGVFAQAWMPDMESLEMQGLGGPTSATAADTAAVRPWGYRRL
jgi:hypothetical protein